jgi:hypothetical protein
MSALHGLRVQHFALSSRKVLQNVTNSVATAMPMMVGLGLSHEKEQDAYIVDAYDVSRTFRFFVGKNEARCRWWVDPQIVGGQETS